MLSILSEEVSEHKQTSSSAFPSLCIVCLRAGFREMLAKRAQLDEEWNKQKNDEAAEMARLADR